MKKIMVIVVMSAIGLLMVDCLVFVVTGEWVEIVMPQIGVTVYPTPSLQDKLDSLYQRFAILVVGVAFLGWIWKTLYQEFIE